MKNGEIGVGIVGLGIGMSRCKMVHEAEGARLVAVCDIDEERGKKAKEQFQTDWHRDYEEMLSREDIDVVMVMTPSGMHASMGIQVAKVEWHGGELFPRVGFIVTNLSWKAKRVVKFYNKRGTAEQWIREGKQALKWTRLSCHGFLANEVRLSAERRIRIGVQLGEFFPPPCTSERDKAVDADNATGEGGEACWVCGLSDLPVRGTQAGGRRLRSAWGCLRRC